MESKINKIIKTLSDNDLEHFSSGKELSANAKGVLKWIGIGIGTAAVLTGVGVGTAALVGWQTGKGKFGYLHDEFADIPYDEDIEISGPFNFQHHMPSFRERHLILGIAKDVYEGIQSMEFTKNGPKLF